jgi:hypothetical protein
MSAVKTFEQIKAHAESIKNDEPQALVAPSHKDAWAQGDLGIVCLETMPKDVEVVEAKAQLAIGNTQGSRHCLVSLQGVTMYRSKSAGPLDGPIFEAKQGCEIDHPEHGNLILPEGIYATVYQRQYAEDLRRVRD